MESKQADLLCDAVARAEYLLPFDDFFELASKTNAQLQQEVKTIECLTDSTDDVQELYAILEVHGGRSALTLRSSLCLCHSFRLFLSFFVLRSSRPFVSCPYVINFHRRILASTLTCG